MGGRRPWLFVGTPTVGDSKSPVPQSVRTPSCRGLRCPAAALSEPSPVGDSDVQQPRCQQPSIVGDPSVQWLRLSEPPTVGDSYAQCLRFSEPPTVGDSSVQCLRFSEPPTVGDSDAQRLCCQHP